MPHGIAFCYQILVLTKIVASGNLTEMLCWEKQPIVNFLCSTDFLKITEVKKTEVLKWNT